MMIACMKVICVLFRLFHPRISCLIHIPLNQIILLTLTWAMAMDRIVEGVDDLEKRVNAGRLN